MPPAIHPARDTAGLHQACVALLEESFQRASIEKSTRQADAELRREALAAMETRKLSPGYYARASYIFGLASAIEWGVAYSPAELLHEDVIGLGIVRRARVEFENAHPSCPFCGERQDNQFAPSCRGCGKKLRGDS